jgi:hypothetical protein
VVVAEEEEEYSTGYGRPTTKKRAERKGNSNNNKIKKQFLRSRHNQWLQKRKNSTIIISFHGASILISFFLTNLNLQGSSRLSSFKKNIDGRRRKRRRRRRRRRKVDGGREEGIIH